MSADLYERIAYLESLVQKLMDRMNGGISRGTLSETNDSNGMQGSRLNGFIEEELSDVQIWQPFGLSANCPAGGDVLITCMGGNRDAAQVVCATHAAYRPTGTEVGGTVIYNAYGDTVRLDSSGITVTSGKSVKVVAAADLTIEAADVSITSDTLTHNGVNIGGTHVHGGVDIGAGNTQVPQ